MSFKNLVLAAMAACTLAAPAVMARSIEFPVQSAALSEIDLDPALTRAKYITGRVTVDYEKGFVRVVLLERNSCDRRGACLPVMNDFRVQLPIKGVKSDSCGSRMILAEENRMPADGAHQRLVVRDNRARTCRDIRPGTEITYGTRHFDRIHGREVRTNSTMSGEALQADHAEFERTRRVRH
jgi:hypothetical protein